MNQLPDNLSQLEMVVLHQNGRIEMIMKQMDEAATQVKSLEETMTEQASGMTMRLDRLARKMESVEQQCGRYDLCLS